jgi:flagellar biogenesis protein FliO
MTPTPPDIAWPALVAVLLLTAAALAVHFWLKRRGVLPGNANPIKLIATRSLGAKRAVAVVEVDEERFLLGLTDGTISLVSKLNSVQRAKAMLQPLSFDAVANAK